MQSQYLKAQEERDKLSTELVRGATGLRDLEIQIGQADEAVTAANNQRMAKVAESQMHSYAAMIFLKSPDEITEKEVHVVLLVFVLLAAFATAIVASLAVYGSFTRFSADDLWACLQARKERPETGQVRSGVGAPRGVRDRPKALPLSLTPCSSR